MERMNEQSTHQKEVGFTVSGLSGAEGGGERVDVGEVG
jgi:hypothetical protein